MVIDAHYHPAFIKEVCGNEELAQRRRNDMAYYKTGVAEVKRIKERMRSSGVDPMITPRCPATGFPMRK